MAPDRRKGRAAGATFFEQALQGALADCAQCLLFRQGGDEFSAIVVGFAGRNFTEDQLRMALDKFTKMVREYTDREEYLDQGGIPHVLSDIPNPKHPSSHGVGVVVAYAPLTSPVESAFEALDKRIEEEKER